MEAAHRLYRVAAVWLGMGMSVGPVAALLLRTCAAIVSSPCGPDGSAALGGAPVPACVQPVGALALLFGFGTLGLCFAGLGVLVMPGMREDWVLARAAATERLLLTYRRDKHSPSWPDAGLSLSLRTANGLF